MVKPSPYLHEEARSEPSSVWLAPGKSISFKYDVAHWDDFGMTEEKHKPEAALLAQSGRFAGR